MDADILKKRLSETFKGDTQDVVARKLNTSQGNVSKWISGQQVPTTDYLFSISEAYRVSVDWLLGRSDEKEIDGIVIDKLSYEQAARVIDRLFELGSIEMPDLNEMNHGTDVFDFCFGDEDDFGDEDEISREKSPSKREPRIDSDYIKVKDRVLSHILRRRLKIYEIGEDMKDVWKTKSLPLYKGRKVLNYSGDMEVAINSRKWTTFVDADWVSLIKELGNLSEEELEDYIKRVEDKEKSGEKDDWQ